MPKQQFQNARGSNSHANSLLRQSPPIHDHAATATMMRKSTVAIAALLPKFTTSRLGTLSDRRHISPSKPPTNSRNLSPLTHPRPYTPRKQCILRVMSNLSIFHLLSTGESRRFRKSRKTRSAPCNVCWVPQGAASRRHAGLPITVPLDAGASTISAQHRGHCSANQFKPTTYDAPAGRWPAIRSAPERAVRPIELLLRECADSADANRKGRRAAVASRQSCHHPAAGSGRNHRRRPTQRPSSRALEV